MSSLDTSTGMAVISVAGFQLLQAWNANAPTLAELRAATPDDVSVRQRLHDADFMVGGLAVVLGTAYTLLTGDVTALIVMLVMFGAASMWHHSVLNAESR